VGLSPRRSSFAAIWRVACVLPVADDPSGSPHPANALVF
jgi:hypothetical protein